MATDAIFMTQYTKCHHHHHHHHKEREFLVLIHIEKLILMTELRIPIF